jgi:hypothetical protein
MLHAAGLTAGRWDGAGRVRPNPGAGTWASPEPVAAPEPDPDAPVATDRDGHERKVYAGLPGLHPRALASPEDRVRWSADVTRPTTTTPGRPW